MKKLVLLPTFLFFVFCVEAQNGKGITGSQNWLSNWTNFKPKSKDYGKPTKILAGIIDKDMTLTKKEVYILMNVVYVTHNATVTIEPGTIIRGDYDSCGTLVITKGAKLIANGNDVDPIVFTSNKEVDDRRPGDWGGIILQGNAPLNTFGDRASLDFNLSPDYASYGGTNPNDNSGILNYVRIEFAGRKLNSKKELNGLSLAGVGKGTRLSNIQVSFSNDDSFECYGGCPILSHIVSYRATDDDFDFTQGAQGFVNNALALRFSFSSDVSRSRCFEIDSYDKIETVDFQKPMTKVIAEDITLIGYDSNAQGLVKEAINIKNDSAFEMKNGIVSGFEEVLLLDDKLLNNTAYKRISLQNILVNNCTSYVTTEKKLGTPEFENWWKQNVFEVGFSTLTLKELFLQFDLKTAPDFRMKNSFSISAN